MVAGSAVAASVKVSRLGDGPIIHAGLDPSIGQNIQGPSLIRVPAWVDKPLGRYYLYFADHKGTYIRLAYADNLLGPWRIHVPGSLELAASHFLTSPPKVDAARREQIQAAFAASGVRIEHDIIEEVTTPHIASPDVHVDDNAQRIRMYYHGLEGVGHQVTRVAESADGIRFDAYRRVLGRTYFRGFAWQGLTYGLAMPGQFYRGADPLGPFEEGPLLFNKNMRHAAVLERDGVLYVFWTQVGDAPEHVKLSTIDLTAEWTRWEASGGHEVLRPELEWEGALAPLAPSVRSTAYGLVNQLRDPAVYEEAGEVFLLYAYGGESGVGLAKVEFIDDPK